MTKLKAFLTALAALHLLLPTAPASADPIKNIVLVHGAWVDASPNQQAHATPVHSSGAHSSSSHPPSQSRNIWQRRSNSCSTAASL